MIRIGLSRNFYTLILAALLFAIALSAFAAPAKISVEAPDVMGFKQGAMVALPPLAELLGAQVKQVKDVITVTRGKQTFACTINAVAAKANGKAARLPLAPFVRNTVAFVPLRALVEALGGKIAMDAKRTSVQVTLPGLAPLTLPYIEMMNGEKSYFTVKEYRDWIDQLYVINPDGSGLRRLTYRAALSYTMPHFSQDGARWVNVNGVAIFPFGLVTAREAASPVSSVVGEGAPSLQQLMSMQEGGSIYFDAALSGDGKTIWYAVVKGTSKEDADAAIMRVPFGGGKAERVATGIEFEITPDEKWLAYNGVAAGEKPGPDSKQALFVRNMVSGREWKLGEGENIQLSADGSAVLFYRSYKENEDDKKGVSMIVTCRLDAAKDEQQLTEAPVDERVKGESDAAFTPDGKKIVFARQSRGGKKTGIYVMNLDRSDVKEITDGDDSAPVCSPDGQFVYFVRNSLIYRVRFDGTGLTLITKSVPHTTTTQKTGDSTMTSEESISIHQLSFTPDGSKLFFLAQPQAMLGWD